MGTRKRSAIVGLHLGPGMGLLCQGTVGASSVLLHLAKWWLPVAAALHPSSTQRSMEAKLGEVVAMCRQQEPSEQAYCDLKAAADTPQSPSLCQSNQSAGQPLPPGSFPTPVPGRPGS